MAHNLSIKAVATSADGFYHRQEYEWKNTNDLFFGWVNKKLMEATKLLAKYSVNKKSDQITVTLSYTADGVVAPDMVIPGISYEELADYELLWAKWSEELANIAKGKAKDQNRKRGWK